MVKITKGNFHNRLVGVPMSGSFGGYDLQINEKMMDMTLRDIAEMIISESGIKLGEVALDTITFSTKRVNIDGLTEEQLKSLKEQGCEF